MVINALKRLSDKRLGNIFSITPEGSTVLIDMEQNRRIPGSFFSSPVKDKESLLLWGKGNYCRLSFTLSHLCDSAAGKINS